MTFGGFAGNLVFGALVLADVLLQDRLFRLKINTNYRLWVIAFLIFAAGFVVWLFDVTKTYCSPLLLLNGRAIFHYCCTVTFYYLYLFYEHNSRNTVKR
jgi:hypothetical protein